MRRLAGPALLGVLALTFILGSLFKGPGLGGGNGAGDSKEQPAQESAKSDVPLDVDKVPPAPTPASTSATTSSSSTPAPDDYPRPLTISIAEYQFAVLTSEKTTKIMPLEEVVMLVKNTPADKSGVRARVSRHVNAQAKAEEDFKQLLEKSGVEPTSVIWAPDLIPETVQ